MPSHLLYRVCVPCQCRRSYSCWNRSEIVAGNHRSVDCMHADLTSMCKVQPYSFCILSVVILTEILSLVHSFYVSTVSMFSNIRISRLWITGEIVPNVEEVKHLVWFFSLSLICITQIILLSSLLLSNFAAVFIFCVVFSLLLADY